MLSCGGESVLTLGREPGTLGLHTLRTTDGRARPDLQPITQDLSDLAPDKNNRELIRALYLFLVYLNRDGYKHIDTLNNISIFLNSIILLLGCVYCCELLDITALLELETQAFRYTSNNIC